MKDGSKFVELKEDRALFARLLVVSKTRDIDLQHNVGLYEFSVVPRALFAPDGSLLHMSSKSELIHILSSLPADSNVDDTERLSLSTLEENVLPRQENYYSADLLKRRLNVAIVDGMADLQRMDKPEWVRTCADLACYLLIVSGRNTALTMKLTLYLIDTILVKNLSNLQLEKDDRLAGSKAVAYEITDSTSLSTINVKKLLGHVKTKDSLTAYIAEKILQHGSVNDKKVVVAWRDKAKSCHRIVNLNSSQEEADTKLMLHAVEATSYGASTLDIFSPDTDVLVLAIRRYPMLLALSSMVVGAGDNRQRIPLGPIYFALGSVKAAALPGFHSFTGADVTGKFSGKGKKTWWKVFEKLDASNDIILVALNLFRKRHFLLLKLLFAKSTFPALR